MGNDFLFLFMHDWSGENCITKSQDFSLVCLQEPVSKTTLTVIHHLKGDSHEQCNHSYRFVAYKQYIGWVMGEWVEEIGKSYHRVLLGLFGKDSLRRMETMYPFENLWKAHRILPATKMRCLKWLLLKFATKWFENPVKESIFEFFRRVRNCNFT